MTFKLMILATVLLVTGPKWHFDLQEAKTLAHNENRQILLNFSGSDWCGPCMRLRADIFESAAFIGFADSSLVLVNADFPRKNKNQLDAAQQTSNNVLADKYNQEGKFPFTLLLDQDGNVLKTWDGYPNMTPDAFINDVSLHMTIHR